MSSNILWKTVLKWFGRNSFKFDMPICLDIHRFYTYKYRQKEEATWVHAYMNMYRKKYILTQNRFRKRMHTTRIHTVTKCYLIPLFGILFTILQLFSKCLQLQRQRTNLLIFIISIAYRLTESCFLKRTCSAAFLFKFIYNYQKNAPPMYWLQVIAYFLSTYLVELMGK